MSNKLKTFTEIIDILRKYQSQGLKIVQCHGVFDLLHPGHIRHLKEAKKLGDKLVVTVTPDRYVNKGPGRPAFNENLRTETLCALGCVDYVVLNDHPDAVTAIEKVRPSIYVKGIEYKDHSADVTGKISAEVNAVEKFGGRIHYSDDIVFSSSALLNKYLSEASEEVTNFIEKIKSNWSAGELIEKVDELSTLKVLIIGDAIVDEYQYVEPLGQSGKGFHMTATCRDNEIFLGGSLIVANHIAEYCEEVTLVTALGRECPNLNFIKATLNPKINCKYVLVEERRTLTKKRYVIQDGRNLTKLFETYSSNNSLLNDRSTNEVIQFIKEDLSSYDLVLVADFGNGFINKIIIDEISKIPNFLAINTQTNSGNRGYNVITNYKRADFISLNQPELCLAAQNRIDPIEIIAERISKQMECKKISITQGVNGVSCFERNKEMIKIPAFVSEAVDRIGAGDSFFALASLCSAKKYPMILQGFIGSMASSLDVQIVGNKEPIKKDALLKFLIRLMK